MIFKKAIEPLIATILLVVVAVILVTIVLAWGKNFANDGLNKTNDVLNDSCDAATINISGCDYSSDGNVIFYLRNTSSTYTFSGGDFQANITQDGNTSATAFNKVVYLAAGTDVATTALGPGQTIVAKAAATGFVTTAGTKVTINVRSVTCPNIAVSEMSSCS
ncbi:MAG: hypothetical protein WCX82_00880 [archaeon]|jgi:hypothetical protein